MIYNISEETNTILSHLIMSVSDAYYSSCDFDAEFNKTNEFEMHGYLDQYNLYFHYDNLELGFHDTGRDWSSTQLITVTLFAQDVSECGNEKFVWALRSSGIDERKNNRSNFSEFTSDLFGDENAFIEWQSEFCEFANAA